MGARCGRCGGGRGGHRVSASSKFAGDALPRCSTAARRGTHRGLQSIGATLRIASSQPDVEDRVLFAIQRCGERGNDGRRIAGHARRAACCRSSGVDPLWRLGSPATATLAAPTLSRRASLSQSRPLDRLCIGPIMHPRANLDGARQSQRMRSETSWAWGNNNELDPRARPPAPPRHVTGKPRAPMPPAPDGT